MVSDGKLAQPPFPLHPRLSWNLRRAVVEEVAHLSCLCRKHSLKCKDMCGSCESNCENRNAEEVTVQTVERDYEDLVLYCPQEERSILTVPMCAKEVNTG